MDANGYARAVTGGLLGTLVGSVAGFWIITRLVEAGSGAGLLGVRGPVGIALALAVAVVSAAAGAGIALRLGRQALALQTAGWVIAIGAVGVAAAALVDPALVFVPPVLVATTAWARSLALRSAQRR